MSGSGWAVGSLRDWGDLDFCGNLDRQGSGIDDHQAADFAASLTCEDQRALEDYLEDQGEQLTSARLLHVGIGNSSLAYRFHLRCRAIDGLTIMPAERARAESLRLLGYTVLELNKYSVEFTRRLTPGYDWIIDNNPASFACCRYHHARLLEHYHWALGPRGRVLTHRRGLDWVALDRRWHMSFNDLAAAASRLGLKAVKLTAEIYALEHDS
jgi:hypothetical protein